MDQQGYAAFGDLNWLNFSVSRNTRDGQRKTAQDRVFGASGWATLARPTAQDPAPTTWTAAAPRVHYPELAAVAPTGIQSASIQLMDERSVARSQLAITWDSTAASLDQAAIGARTYLAQVASHSGPNVAYPEPALLVASASDGVRLIARANLATTVQPPGGAPFSLQLRDDGQPPDVLADDGRYTGFMPYQANGAHDVTVTFDNAAGTAVLTEIGAQHSLGPNGEVYSPTVTLVGEPFTASASAQITISGVQADDHGDVAAAATPLTPDNTRVTGRIDRADDVDVFSVTPLASGDLVLRVSDLVSGMRLRVRLLAEDGVTELGRYAIDSSTGVYLHIDRGVEAGRTLYLTVADDGSTAAVTAYRVSAGPALANTIETWPELHLPWVSRE